jgi:general secretion pathway protein L
LSTLYIRLASKAVAGSAPQWPALPCIFALVSHGSSIERQGTAPLSDLSDTVATAQRVVLLLAASDVTLLRVKVPPLSPARLKAALPNLVEDQLIGDPPDCVIVAGGLAEGLRTIAVVQRAWLETLSSTLVSYGARQIAALPAQLCLPCQSAQSGQQGSVAVAVSELNHAIDVTLRLSEHDGIGLAIGAAPDASAAREVIQTLCAVVPEASIALYVPQSGVAAYQQVVNDSGALNKRISVLTDNWSRWISGANGATLDLMAGLGAGAGPRLDLRAWRWPLALAATVLLINVATLNIDWWRMKAEAKSLRASMIQVYKSAFPKETVIIDPAAQMKQKIAMARHDAGLASPDDFTAITATFGEAWASVAAASGKPSAIAALEYRERVLFVRFQPNAEAPMQQMKTALAERNLSLDQETSGSAAVWKIRSAK